MFLALRILVESLAFMAVMVAPVALLIGFAVLHTRQQKAADLRAMRIRRERFAQEARERLAA